MISFNDLEMFILQELDALKTSNGVDLLDTYRGECSSDSLTELALSTPAVFVHIADLDNAAHRREDVRELTIHVYCLDADTRGSDADGRPGIYRLNRLIINRLNRKSFPDAGTLLLRDCATIFYSRLKGLCVCRLSFSLELRIDPYGEITAN